MKASALSPGPADAPKLMIMWFTRYCLLFSVSLIRIIYDIADPDNQPVALRAISRW